jgi:hypothetical protein
MPGKLRSPGVARRGDALPVLSVAEQLEQIATSGAPMWTVGFKLGRGKTSSFELISLLRAETTPLVSSSVYRMPRSESAEPIRESNGVGCGTPSSTAAQFSNEPCVHSLKAANTAASGEFRGHRDQQKM